MRTLFRAAFTLSIGLLLSCAATGPPAVDNPPVDKARVTAFCEKSVQTNMHAAAQRHAVGMPLQAIVMDFAKFAEADGMNKAYRNAIIELIAAMLVDRDSMMAAYEKAVRICSSLQ